jgi:hypothetical protein
VGTSGPEWKATRPEGSGQRFALRGNQGALPAGRHHGPPTREYHRYTGETARGHMNHGPVVSEAVVTVDIPRPRAQERRGSYRRSPENVTVSCFLSGVRALGAGRPGATAESVLCIKDFAVER